MSDHQKCGRPPLGWECSRERGHEGPCAASPTEMAIAALEGEVTVDGRLLQELTLAGNALVDAAEGHWDAIPLAAAVARWEAALFAVGRSAR